jgi:hypothetical protein
VSKNLQHKSTRRQKGGIVTLVLLLLLVVVVVVMMRVWRVLLLVPLRGVRCLPVQNG